MEFIQEIFSTVTDVTVYFVMGAMGTAMFMLKLVMMLAFGGDSDIDIDVDGGFSLFSMLSILAFMMGAGWLGLACRVEWDLGHVLSALCAGAFGFSLMLLCSAGMFQMRRMNEVPRYDVRNCIGHIGESYVNIPAKGAGRGQVQITVDGRRKVLPAVSNGAGIESFASVKVVDVQEGRTLIVEKE